MKYMGSKNRHAKEILEAIKQEIVGCESFSKIPYSNWVEPFVGGANMIDKIPSSFQKYGNDINVHLIEMFKAVQTGWIPPDYVTEEEYKQLRSKSDIYCTGIESALIGFVGIGCSYSGKWFGGFARNVGKEKPNADVLFKTSRNYCAESKRNILKQLPNILDVKFTSGNYYDMNIPPDSIIYCDPPYAGTTKYRDYFDHKNFWEWCSEMVELGHKVFVSEYNAPDGWRCIWSKQVNNSLTQDTGSKKGTEKLFTK